MQVIITRTVDYTYDIEDYYLSKNELLSMSDEEIKDFIISTQTSMNISMAR